MKPELSAIDKDNYVIPVWLIWKTEKETAQKRDLLQWRST